MWQILGLVEDFFDLIRLEAKFGKNRLKRLAVAWAVVVCATLAAAVLLHVAAIGGFLAAGWRLWQAALGLALLELILVFTLRQLIKRWSRQAVFQSSREELRKTVLWMKQRFN